MLYAATCLTPKQENSQVYHGYIWGLCFLDTKSRLLESNSADNELRAMTFGVFPCILSVLLTRLQQTNFHVIQSIYKFRKPTK